SWAVGIFGEPLSTATPPTSSASSATATTDDERGGASARGSYAPFIAEGRVLHLAASAHYRVPAQSGAANAQLRLSSKPEMNQFPDRLLNTGNITGDVNHYQVSAVEAAGAFGALLAQAEYTLATVARDRAADADFSGGYGQVSWALTGERRPYKADKGIFEGIRPSGAVAWELAARYSRMDLGDAGINGGREQNAALALNAYIGPFVKLSGNYVKVLKTEGGPFAGDEPSALMLRAQFAY
ncbi:MAG: porin, partial [Pedobacter sp.]|nr:porin [Pedobacter sp.]